MTRLRLLWRRMRGMTCAHWPCKRCDKAGRTSWRSRERWHAARRRIVGWAAFYAVAVVAWIAVVWAVAR